jgi:RNA polymerase sigma-70 factor (ECF subfamily)
MATEIERLYRQHRAGLIRLVERELHDRHDAEDVVQTAFLDAQRALERGTVPHNPSAWLAAIALNAGRRLRRRHLNAEPLEEYAVQEAAGVPEIRAALASLPTEQRTAVVYRDLLGLSYSETAEQMGRSVDAVTMLLHRGRRRLRQTLGVAAGGTGLWRWLRRAGMPQVAAVKSAAAIVAAGLATTGIVTARAVAPIGTHLSAPATARSGSRTAEAVRTPGGLAGSAPARRQIGTAGRSNVRAVPEPTLDSGAAAPPARSSTAAADPSLLPSTLPLPTVSLPTLQIPTSPATVTVGTPITTVALTTLTGTTATVTTPITTVTVPIP